MPVAPLVESKRQTTSQRRAAKELATRIFTANQQLTGKLV
jgi:hypothetical protein